MNKNKEGNLSRESKDVGEVLNRYLESVFTKEKDLEVSEISVSNTNRFKAIWDQGGDGVGSLEKH